MRHARQFVRIHVLARRADVQLVELRPSERAARRVLHRDRHDAVDAAIGPIANYARSAPLRVPQVALGVDDRTVGRCTCGIDAREAAHVGYFGAIGVVIAAEDYRLAGIAEIHRAAVEAEADRIWNGRSRQRETAQAVGEGKLVEAARRAAAFVL